MDGGALIGHGNYGCVFDQPLRVISRITGNCEKLNTTAKVIGKISKSEDVHNEIEAAKHLSKVPNSALYITIANLNNIHRPCEIKDQADISSLEKCPIVQKLRMSHMLHFTMPHSGIDLSSYFNIHTKSKSPIPFEKVVIHLLEGVSLLHLNNYVHYDIHSNNILFDDATKMPRIIDFGFSFSVTELDKKTLDKRWKEYSPDFPSEAPELTAIQGIRHKLSLNTVIHDIITKKAPLKLAQFVLGLSMKDQEESFRAFWNKSKSIQDADWVNFFKYYWPGFDSWCVGVVILKMYSNIAQIPLYTKDPSWKNLSKKVKEILRLLLRMNPLERIDCIEALYIFHPESEMLKSDTASTWIQDREAFRRPIRV
jgi:serine/threonine protein kinase